MLNVDPVMVFAFSPTGSHVAAMFTYGGSTTGIQITTILPSIPLTGVCDSKWPLLPLLQVRGALCYPISFPEPFHQFDVGYTALEAWQSPLIFPPFPMGGEGSYFPGCTPPNDIADSKSVLGIKPVTSGPSS